MDDIAERLGVSKGTIYRAVESKGALFAAVIARGDTPAQGLGDAGTPTDDVTSLAATVSTQLAEAVAALELTTIVSQRTRLRASGFGDEVERITNGLHQVMRSRRTAIMVLDRCAGEIPEPCDRPISPSRSTPQSSPAPSSN
jgi:AcrR family transcriptional regulator